MATPIVGECSIDIRLVWRSGHKPLAIVVDLPLGRAARIRSFSAARRRRCSILRLLNPMAESFPTNA
jgi:hypothetical protein